MQRKTLDQIPDLAALHELAPQRYPHLLASTASGGALAHFSLLLIATEEILALWHDGRLQTPDGQQTKGGFLKQLNAWIRAECLPRPRPDPEFPFTGGWFLYLGYELAAEIEPRLELPAFDPEFPAAFAQRCPGAVIVNHVSGSAHLVAEPDLDLEAVIADIEQLGAGAGPAELPCTVRLKADPPQRFVAGVNRIKEYILAGDVFQVNLSRGWRGEAECPLDPVRLFRRLGSNNAAPFAGLSRFGDAAIISSSPERLVEVKGHSVQTRPIAGTRPRSADSRVDQALSRELIAHYKERAEHIMLIDLERNDLGRVCQPGTVEVDELMVIESYAHVHHIVSNVRGRLRDEVSAVDVIAALFPGGTITGCPKVRCMEIIAELENAGRGFYTGSMGYLSRDGKMDLNILIRSMFVRGKQLNFRTGAGIVADSVAEREVDETLAKAKGLLLALDLKPDV